MRQAALYFLPLAAGSLTQWITARCFACFYVGSAHVLYQNQNSCSASNVETSGLKAQLTTFTVHLVDIFRSETKR